MGDRPYCLLDFFSTNAESFQGDKNRYLVIMDESHVTLPQVGGMYSGDLARKKNLVEHGFRLPCAYDNRPLRIDEFQDLIPQMLYVSATLVKGSSVTWLRSPDRRSLANYCMFLQEAEQVRRIRKKRREWIH